MQVEDAGAEALEALVKELVDIRHDLGKYVCFEVRFVGLDCGDEALREALESDLRRTRSARGPDGRDLNESAWDLWARLRPSTLADDPDVRKIDALVAELQAADLGADGPVLRKAAESALEVGVLTRRLLDRGRAALARTQGDAHG